MANGNGNGGGGNGGGKGQGGNNDQEKCRTSEVHRYGNAQGWVDVEVLTHASFKGAQWKGPVQGNQAQETIFTLDESLIGTGGDAVEVSMTPGNGATVSVPGRASARFATRYGHVERYFSNSEKNSCREDDKRRIRFNHIEDEFLEDGKPPKKPKKYMEAVKETKDGSDLYLDIAIAKKAKLMRAKDNPRTAIDFTNVWGGAKVNLPGGGTNTDPKRKHIRLDPFQTIINFGPDGLAVEFHPGAEPPYSRKRS